MFPVNVNVAVIGSDVFHNDIVCDLVNTFVKRDSNAVDLASININSRKYGLQNLTVQNVQFLKP